MFFLQQWFCLVSIVRDAERLLVSVYSADLCPRKNAVWCCCRSLSVYFCWVRLADAVLVLFESSVITLTVHLRNGLLPIKT